MAELLEKDCQKNIDAKKNEIEKLEIRVNFLKTKRRNDLTKSGLVGEIDISMKMELNITRVALSISRSEIDSAWEFINSMKKERLKKETAKEQNQRDRVQELVSRQNISSQKRPKFGDALTLYSDDHLEKEIENITEEDQEVKSKILTVVPKNKALVSENSLSEDSAVNLRELKAFWVNSKFNQILAREQGECLNKEIREKIELSKRKIALINHSF